MTKDEQFASVKANILSAINSWDDLYQFFDEIMARVAETMHPHFVFDALFTMYAFMQAMRELPEEGDIKVLTERMLYILVYESKEKLGADCTIVTKAEAEERTAEQVRQLSKIAVAEALAEYEKEGVKVLH